MSIDLKISIEYINFMDKSSTKQIKEIMMQVFNEGSEEVLFPRLDNMQEEIEVRIKESEKRIKKELSKEFKAGQRSLNERLEVVERDMDKMGRVIKVA